MKKLTLLFASLLCVAYIAVAQLKLYVYQNDGTRTEFVASTVDSIAFSSITDGPKDTGIADGHEWVDLGLPSGTKWATMNVGADSPEDYGDYFAWGETTNWYNGIPKFLYEMRNYKWYDDIDDTMTKYCTSSLDGIVDNKTTLDLSDDAAYVNWGGDWRMPTKEEQDELLTKCIWRWTTQNGVNGYQVISRVNANSIFLPAAGYHDNSGRRDAGSGGYYWSSELNTSRSYYAYSLLFGSGVVSNNYDYSSRSDGRCVRPVLRDVEFTFTIMFDGNGGEGTMPAIDVQHDDRVKIPASTFTREGYYFASWNTKADGTGTSYMVGEVITQAEDLTLYAQWGAPKDTGIADGHEWVDLGLPSGTKWATCNVGADSLEEYGDYFAWGKTTPQSTYNWSTYKWCKGTYATLTKYCTDSEYGIVDNKTTLDLSDDAAYVNWGSSWRMPTKAEQDELRNTNYTTWTWTTLNGVKGYKVTSKTNGNSIFLPSAGCRSNSGLNGAGTRGYYWSSSLSTGSSNSSNYACYLYFYSGDVDSYYYGNYRYYGQSVRPVLAK